MVGDDVAWSSLSVSLSSVAVVVQCCPSWVVVHRSLVSVIRSRPSLVVMWFCVAGVALAMGEVDSSGVHGFRGNRSSFAGCCILCTSLLPLLGGRGVALGGCCRSWTAGTV